jgi:hypothetical protein
MGELEAGADFVVWRDGRPGRGLVHRTVLRTLLFADDFESEHDIRKLHRRDRVVNGDAVLRFVWRSVGSSGTQEDHDARLHPGGRLLLAHL